MVFVYMLYELSNDLRLIKFTDQETVKLEHYDFLNKT